MISTYYSLTKINGKKLNLKKIIFKTHILSLLIIFLIKKKNKFQSKQIAKHDDALFVLNTIKKIKKDKRN